MSESTAEVTRPGFRAWLAAQPRWTKILLALACASIVTGAVMAIVAPPPTAPLAGTQPNLGNNFAPQGPGEQTPGQGAPVDDGADPSSVGFMRLGFGFIAGFCMGYALRAVLRLAAIFAGLQLFVLFLLDYTQIAPVDWLRLEQLWDGLVASLSSETADFRTFVLGRLPAAGLFVTGFYAGFRRRR